LDWGWGWRNKTHWILFDNFDKESEFFRFSGKKGKKDEVAESRNYKAR